jgi:nitrogenase molybdenum-cofactor synthesis protein NifE
LHRLSFSTDLQEKDVIFGGEDKLYQALIELIDRHEPKAAFVYSTCIVGRDDLGLCAGAWPTKGIRLFLFSRKGSREQTCRCSA